MVVSGAADRPAALLNDSANKKRSYEMPKPAESKSFNKKIAPDALAVLDVGSSADQRALPEVGSSSSADRRAVPEVTLKELKEDYEQKVVELREATAQLQKDAEQLKSLQSQLDRQRELLLQEKQDQMKSQKLQDATAQTSDFVEEKNKNKSKSDFVEEKSKVRPDAQLGRNLLPANGREIGNFITEDPRSAEFDQRVIISAGTSPMVGESL
jgi:hypothetical protein